MEVTGEAPHADDDAQPSRHCDDCIGSPLVQGGAWGWAAHRHFLHGEGDKPGPHPGSAPPTRGEPWTPERHAEARRRRTAARRKTRRPPAVVDHWTPPPAAPARTPTAACGHKVCRKLGACAFGGLP